MMLTVAAQESGVRGPAGGRHHRLQSAEPAAFRRAARFGEPRRSLGGGGFAIVKLDPALDAIVSPDATLDTIGDRFGLTEGPVWIQDGAAAICCSATSSRT